MKDATGGLIKDSVKITCSNMMLHEEQRFAE